MRGLLLMRREVHFPASVSGLDRAGHILRNQLLFRAKVRGPGLG
jgi:hypothetical protein